MYKIGIITVGLLIIIASGLFAQEDDLLNDYIRNLPKEELSENELDGLKHMREEEKLARDVYKALYDKWNINIFNNIVKSEQSHADMVAIIISKYNLEDPFVNEYGVFTDSTIQALYNTLVGIGNESTIKAMFVGCTIEDLDIYDLEEYLLVSDNQDVRTVYQNLMKGSRNHMRSFEGQYSSMGATYSAQYITDEELQQILSSGIEPGVVDADGNPLSLTSVDGADQFSLPEYFELAQNYPNPFNPSTTIQFALPEMSVISLNIYDILGGLVKTLADNEMYSPGMHSLSWNGMDNSGNLVSSGTYLYQIQNGAVKSTKRMSLIK